MTIIYSYNSSKYFLCTALLLYSLPAFAVPSKNTAQYLPDALKQCRHLPDRERLACYDQIAFKDSDEGKIAVRTESKTASAAAQDPNQPLLHETAEHPKHTTSAVTSPASASPMESMWELRDDIKHSLFSLQAYQPNYVLFGQYGNKVNRQPESSVPGRSPANARNYSQTEAKFQISIRSKLAHNLLHDNDSFWFGYSQISHWQIWSPEISRPFRATSYKPELIYITPIQYPIPGTGWTLRMASLGLIHESNGQSNPLSRSWNRVYLGLGLDRNDFSVYARLWKRLPESAKDNDNPDITGYMGRADLRMSWNIDPDNTVAMTIASNLRNTRGGSVQLDYYFPLSELWGMGDYLRGYVQLFHGYGETITDYNFRRTALGIGVAIKEW